MVAFTVLVAFALWLWAPRDRMLGWLAEGGVVEVLTQALYFTLAPALLWLRVGDRQHLRTWCALAVVVAGFGAREADLHTAWTAKSVLKLSFYFGDAPWGQKVLAGFVVAAVATAAAHILLRCHRAFWLSLKQRQPVAATLLVFVLTLVASKILDRSVDILAEDFGVVLLQSTRALMTALEELLELSLPVLAGLALAQYRRGFFASARRAASQGTWPASPMNARR